MPVEDGEEESLHAVGEQPRLEAAAEEADEAVLIHDVSHHLWVGDHVRERLSRRLDNPEGIQAARILPCKKTAIVNVI